MIGKCKLSDIKNYNDLNYSDSGIYILRINGIIQKVGSAKIGLKKRMQQYYDLNLWCGLNKYINLNNRDLIEVEFQTCNRKDCTELESKLFDKYNIASMPWAKRRPHSKRNKAELLI